MIETSINRASDVRTVHCRSVGGSFGTAVAASNTYQEEANRKYAIAEAVRSGRTRNATHVV